ncbi:hypothetical protein ACFL2D_02250 [Patescibacteria group bacterium]
MVLGNKPHRKKVDYLEKSILDYSRKNSRVLPWRKSGITPYEIWVSEIMLQQTQVSRVIDFYERFLNKYPTVQDLARARWDGFLSVYRGLGYYSRGRNMIQCAKMVVSEYNGEFPNDREKLILFPGIGEYTANAILSFAFDEDSLAFDTNFQKVFGRYFSGNKGSDGMDSIQIIVRDKRVFNGAVMDFANDICLSRPRCEVCPLSMKCTYSKENGKQEQPLPQRKKKSQKNRVAYVWLHQNHRMYFSSRKDRFQEFRLPKGLVSRKSIKDYFQEQYGLELSVRPPHKSQSLGELEILNINAQILLGKHDFVAYPRKAISGRIKHSQKKAQ